MIVVDACAVVELLLNTAAADRVAELVLGGSQTPAAPQLLDIEVLQALRRYARTGELPAERALQAVEDLADLPIARFPHEPLLERIWALRDNLTAYDATYVALAEALEATLITRDKRLASAPGHQASIEVV